MADADISRDNVCWKIPLLNHHRDLDQSVQLAKASCLGIMLVFVSSVTPFSAKLAPTSLVHLRFPKPHRHVPFA